MFFGRALAQFAAPQMLRLRLAGETRFELCQEIHQSQIEHELDAETILFAEPMGWQPQGIWSPISRLTVSDLSLDRAGNVGHSAGLAPEMHYRMIESPIPHT